MGFGVGMSSFLLLVFFFLYRGFVYDVKSMLSSVLLSISIFACSYREPGKEGYDGVYLDLSQR
jgi:hypothetical protein